MTQNWKTDPELYDCDTIAEGGQENKLLDYDNIYVEEFLNADPLRDWESIDRCVELFNFCIEKGMEINEDMVFLDCGSKDGQMIDWLRKEHNIEALGLEVSEPYVGYSNERGRLTVLGDMCCLPEEFSDKFDIVFAHHVLGLTRDYRGALSEMLRSIKIGGYLITLNHVPGNRRKHFSYIDSTNVYDTWFNTSLFKSIEMMYYGNNPHQKPGDSSKEVIIFMKKTGENETLEMNRPSFDPYKDAFSRLDLIEIPVVPEIKKVAPKAKVKPTSKKRPIRKLKRVK
jgi:SAM-dependent methyltransferase